MFKNFSLALLFLAVLFLSPATIANAAVLSVDKEDYEPGQTVLYSGSGFIGGETVNLAALGSTNGTQISTKATAADNGDISGSFDLPAMYEATYTLTATGASSGFTASVIFHDSVGQFAMNSPTTVVTIHPGDTQVFTVLARATGGGAPPIQGVTVDWTAGGGTMSPTSGVTGSDGKCSSTFTAGSTPGTYTVTATAPGAGPSGQDKTAKQDITIEAVVPSDSIAPVTTIALQGTAGNHGWFISDVNVTLTATDNDSGVKEIRYTLNGTGFTVSSATVTFKVSTEGINTLEFWAVDNANNEETHQSQEIKIDKTAPAIIASRDPAANSFGWNNTDVTVSFDTSDAVSGIDPNTDPCDIILSNEGQNQSAGGTVYDMAGNSAYDGITGINIDKTDPVVTITTPDVNAAYILNQQVYADWSATDALSGIDAGNTSGTIASGASIPTDTVGAKTFTVTATDKAGNVKIVTITYFVRYNFIGFLPPVDDPPVINVGKAGRTFPIKWQLKDACGSYICSLSVVKCNPLRCKQLATSGESIWYDIIADTSGASGLHYDSTKNEFIFNWKTATSYANKSYELALELNDGCVYTAIFKFTK